MDVAKFLILLISKNICDRLHFGFFNGSHLHGPKGLDCLGLDCLDCVTASGFRI